MSPIPRAGFKIKKKEYQAKHQMKGKEVQKQHSKNDQLPVIVTLHLGISEESTSKQQKQGVGMFTLFKNILLSRCWIKCVQGGNIVSGELQQAPVRRKNM